MIDRDGRACLAGFTLLTIAASESTSTISSHTSGVWGGAIQWMSPELLDPEPFGLEGGRPTRQSDCYALGMMVYEVLGGRAPFAQYDDSIVTQKVLRGERPGRPRGDRGKLFTDDILGLLELCWKPQPGDRPNVEDVLLGLGGNPLPSRPTSDEVGGMEMDRGVRTGTTTGESSTFLCLISGSTLNILWFTVPLTTHDETGRRALSYPNPDYGASRSSPPDDPIQRISSMFFPFHFEHRVHA